MNIHWIGISNQKNAEGNSIAAFSPDTPTGKYLLDLIALCPENFKHTKMNYVNNVLLNDKGKLRNPTKLELDQAWERFSDLLMGSSETTFVFFSGALRQFLSKKIFGEIMPKYEILKSQSNLITFFDHPSYINIYKHNQRDEYLRKMAALIYSSHS